MKSRILVFAIVWSFSGMGQNNLNIPPIIETNTINLILDEGVTQFYSGVNTNTMGANGPLLGPTLIMSAGDSIDITVDNQLSEATTIHWHGMHVAPENDGGPHSIIPSGTSWNPKFKVLDKAGLNWYHPHLHMQTDKHVSKGIAGMIIIRDEEEESLGLPQTYGVDEFPLVLQTKGFDSGGQILVHTDLDTSVMVNGTVDATVDFPAQVVRLRVLNGASQRVMEFGFSDDRAFSLIGTDGGLLTAPLNLTRYRLAPGQRADILLDLSSSFGQSIKIMSFASELPNAIYGATQPGMGPGATSSLPDYTNNPLNGNDYELLNINVIAATSTPITTIPNTLALYTALQESAANITRELVFTSAGAMGNLNGPFLINGETFNMDSMNYIVPLGNIEIWSLTNQTPIAHPFHIHDVQFFILDINGNPPPPALQGYNDVVLVPGGMGNVRLITQFNDHSNETMPFMFHCHMLTHEDMGMMGQFLVVDTTSSIEELSVGNLILYPNPACNLLVLNYEGQGAYDVQIIDILGKIVFRKKNLAKGDRLTIDTAELSEGLYTIRVTDEHSELAQKLIIHK